jgi:hypothetical protein
MILKNLRQKLMQAAAVIAVLTGTASAQMPMPSISLGGDHKRPLTPEELKRQQQIDQAYKAATSKIPDKQPVDPWGDVRPAPPPAPQKKKATN